METFLFNPCRAPIKLEYNCMRNHSFINEEEVMEKTKLGVSVGFVGALAFLLTYFSGYMVAILLAGYVLLREDSSWLKKACGKAIFLALCFDVLQRVIAFIPDMLGCVGTLTNLFDIDFSYSIVTNIISLITRPLNIVEACLFLILGLLAFKQKTIPIPFIDKLFD